MNTTQPNLPKIQLGTSITYNLNMYVYFFVTSLTLVFTLACRLRVATLFVAFFPSLVITLLPFPLDEVGVP